MARQTTHRPTRAYIAVPLLAILGGLTGGCGALPSGPSEQVISSPAAESMPPQVAPQAGGEGASDGSSITPLASSDSQSSSTESTTPSTPELDSATEALFNSIKEHDGKAVTQALDDGADLEGLDSYGRTPLMRAVVSNDSDIALQLLDEGADPDTLDKYHESPFLRASSQSMLEVIEACVENGADLSSTNRIGSTALSAASERGHVESVRYLLTLDIDVNHVNDLGWTALHETVSLGRGASDFVSIAQLLVDAGADTSIPDRTGRTALELAEQRGQKQMAAVLRAAE